MMTPDVSPYFPNGAPEVDFRRLEQLLQMPFGMSEFRPGQLEVITSLLSGRDVLAIMPTGSGKSLCYQLPTLYQRGVTVVITPLIALMEDQVAKLQALGIPSGCLHSGQSRLVQARVFATLKSSESFLLYVSPERVQRPQFANWALVQKIAIFAVDEAHCISQWGPEFREDYHRLHRLRDIRPRTPILALTGTASLGVVRDIMAQLKLVRPVRCIQGLSRSNIYCQVVRCESSDEKWKYVLQSLQQFCHGKILIYCGTRRQCEALSRSIQRHVDTYSVCEFYHAGLPSELRLQIQQRFASGETRILVATSAFGMGVDYPDIRLVVHFQIPSSLDEYCQEMGRAGRDGSFATSLVLFCEKDRGLHAHFINHSQSGKRLIRQRWRSLDEMVDFARAKGCREQELFRSFAASARAARCGHCDICDPDSIHRVRLGEPTEISG